jgi:hypothetical protein
MLASTLHLAITALSVLAFIAQVSGNNDFALKSLSLHRRAYITETLCDDNQDNIKANPLYHAVLLANATIDKKLLDGTDFRHSTG